MGTVLLGFLVATAIGACGVGAGILTAPALIVLFDMPPATAVGTALAFGTLVKIPAAFAYARRGLVAWPVARRMLAYGLPGVLVGALVVGSLDRASLRAPVLVGVGTVVTLAALLGLLRRPQGCAREGAPDHATVRSRGALALCLPIGIEVGFSSAGAGALGTLLLLRTTALAPAAVVGTDLVFGAGLAVVGAAVHASAGTIDTVRLLALVAGGVAGASVGVRIAARLPATRLRRALLATVALLGVHMAYRGSVGADSATLPASCTQAPKDGP
ncbi:MAG: sulfite exporter TauE/SafE family protein [Deltaproteobacteria bacterium]|nr:MAG: sulfite exporter TauE/SafE family protein [Deltaproteobacteria bacterium]